MTISKRWILGTVLVGSMAGGALGGAVLSSSIGNAATGSPATTTTQTTSPGGTFVPNTSPAHEASESTTRAAQEASGQGGPGSGGKFIPNPDPAHEATESAARAAQENAGQIPTVPSPGPPQGGSDTRRPTLFAVAGCRPLRAR
jgi:hypothetical protein